MITSLLRFTHPNSALSASIPQHKNWTRYTVGRHNQVHRQNTGKTQESNAELEKEADKLTQSKKETQTSSHYDGEDWSRSEETKQQSK